MTKIDLATVERIIREVGMEAVMPRFRKLAENDVTMKGVNDPVTVADQEAERLLTERLTAYLPGSVVVGEETFATDKNIMQRLDSDAPVWIIDPIDGTRNFVAGHPEFAVMVALVQANRCLASWIHDPNSGDTVMAEQGGGVWLSGQRMRLAATVAGLPTVGLVGSRVKPMVSDLSVMPRGGELPPIEVGSCGGFDYPRLFAGPVSFADATSSRVAFLFYRHTNAWDHAPGLFLHQEGGGYSANWAGTPYDMRDARNGLLIAQDRAAWNHLHQLFQPLMQHILRKAG